MTETWACSQCGGAVPADCDGTCGKGTWSDRCRRAAVVAVLAVSVAVGVAGCQLGAQHPGTDPATGVDVPFSAGCDVNARPVDVRPDTDAARRAAARMCAASASELDNAPWPSGWHLIPGGAVGHR